MEGIYCYTDLKTDKVVYVGKDSHIDKNSRHKRHCTPSCYNEQQINRVLQNTPDRYFYKVLKQGNFSKNLLNALEILYIKRYSPRFNFTKGGEGLCGFSHSKESIEKMSRVKKGKKRSLKTRKKISESRKGLKCSLKTRKKMSKAKKGENNHFYGKTHSMESLKKMSNSKNSTGFFRVHKSKGESYKQGFTWRYCYWENGQQKSINSVDIKKLERMVKSKGLEWFKLTEIEGGS